MNNKPNDSKDKYIEFILEEYRFLNARTISDENGRRQIVGVQVAVVAASLSAITIFQDQPIFYLFGSLVLLLLAWISMEETARTHGHNLYLQKVIVPKINDLFKNETAPALGLDKWVFRLTPSSLAASVMGFAKYALGFGLALLFIVLFYLSKNNAGTDWTLEENILFYTNLVFFFTPMLLGLISIITIGVNEFIKSIRKSDIEEYTGKSRRNKK